MSRKKKKTAPVVRHHTSTEIKTPSAPPTPEQKAKGQKIKMNTVVVFALSLIAMLAIFGGRWLWAVMEEYYGAFVERYSYSVSEAVEYMEGLDLSGEEEDALLPLQQKWDLFTSARLRDEVSITSYDGTQLHGYLYNENSDITVVVLPRFDQDGEDDFLPGDWIHELTGCNILLPDPRNHGQSGGEKFGFGYFEQHDLVCWLEWAQAELGTQSFILWGEGTGANTILFAEVNGLLPDSVAFAVVESSFASLHEMAWTQISDWYTVPAFPFLTAVEWKVNRESGFHMNDLDLASALESRQCELPVLFLESAVDTYIYPEWSQEVYHSYSGEKSRISGGLSHGTVYAYRQEEIHAAVSAWVNRYIS